MRDGWQRLFAAAINEPASVLPSAQSATRAGMQARWERLARSCRPPIRADQVMTMFPRKGLCNTVEAYGYTGLDVAQTRLLLRLHDALTVRQDACGKNTWLANGSDRGDLHALSYAQSFQLVKNLNLAHSRAKLRLPITANSSATHCSIAYAHSTREHSLRRTCSKSNPEKAGSARPSQTKEPDCAMSRTHNEAAIINDTSP